MLVIVILIMNEDKTVKNRFATRREAALRQIAGIGPFIEGTLVKVPHKTCRHVAHRLALRRAVLSGRGRHGPVVVPAAAPPAPSGLCASRTPAAARPAVHQQPLRAAPGTLPFALKRHSASLGRVGPTPPGMPAHHFLRS